MFEHAIFFILFFFTAAARGGTPWALQTSQWVPGRSLLDEVLHLTARGAPAMKLVVRGPTELTPRLGVRGPKELTPMLVVRGPRELTSGSTLECLVLNGGLRNFAR